MTCPTIHAKTHEKIHAKRFGSAAAIALFLAIAAPGNGHAQYRIADHPAHVNVLPRNALPRNVLPRPPMRPLQTGAVAAVPAAQAPPPRTMQPAPSAAMGYTEDTGHAGDHHDHDRGPRGPRVIVIGVPSAYYGPGYDGDQYGDGGPAVGPSPPGDTGVTDCAQTYSSYDPQSGTYIGDDGNPHPCP